MGHVLLSFSRRPCWGEQYWSHQGGTGKWQRCTESTLKGCSRHGRKWQTQAWNPVFVQPPLVLPTEITQKVAVWAHFPTLVSSKLSETQDSRRNLIFCWTKAFGFWHAGSFQIPCHCSNSFSFFPVQSNFFSEPNFSVMPTFPHAAFSRHCDLLRSLSSQGRRPI